MALEMGRPEFEGLVERALAEIPAELAELVENCVLLVEDWPPQDQPGLLGLYRGVPLTERGEFYAGALPDQITIFRGPILSRCTSEAGPSAR